MTHKARADRGAAVAGRDGFVCQRPHDNEKGALACAFLMAGSSLRSGADPDL